LAGLCVTFYGASFPFHTFAQKYLVEAHGISNAQASLLTATPTCMALVATPFVGWLVDRVDHRLGFLILGSSLMFAAFLAFCSCRVMPVLPILLMGAAYAPVPTVMWPSVARIVPSGDMGKAYGLMAWFESLGLGGCNLLIGWVHGRARAGTANPHGHQAGMGPLSILTLLGLLFNLRIRRRRL
jgi:predicted MFS family arabinose efflux permease